MKELLGEETVRSIRKNKYFRWAFWAGKYKKKRHFTVP